MHSLIFGYPAFPIVFAFMMVIALGINLTLIHRQGHPIRPVVAFLVAFCAIGMVGAKVFSWFMRGHIDPIGVELYNGYRYPGAMIAVILAIPFLRRLLPTDFSLKELCDLLAPGTVFALAIYRVQCLLVGCCVGQPTSVPWAIRFPRYSAPWLHQAHENLISRQELLSLPVHPLQIYFLIASLAVGFFLLWLLPRKSYDGQVILAYFALHESSKFLLEFLRDPIEPAIQFTSLAIALVAVGALLVVKLRSYRSHAIEPAPGES